MKPARIIGLTIILASVAFCAKALVTNLTPYVTFTQARQTQSGSVQVMGALDKKSIKADAAGMTFDIISKDDAKDHMTVSFSQTRPANFALAIEVTAIGRYQGGVFHADKLLVKCPSKYQGTETKEYGNKPGG